MDDFDTGHDGLARLSMLVETAQKLAWQLRMDEGASGEARALYGRLEEIRLEVEALSRSGVPVVEPGCTELLQKLGFSGLVRDERG